MDTRPTLPGGIIDGSRHLYAVRAYYEDTDLSGIVYHANYLRWFERARSDLLRLLDIDQRAAIEAGDGAYAVADLQIRYVRPVKLDDDVIIITRCIRMGAASVHMHQHAICAADGEDLLMCEATLRVGFIAPDGRPRRQPAAWRDAFATLLSEEHAA